ncbi:MAG: dephospho-CoA kinase, partial [Gammaproteobacteria bacterium]|nr:dephospho-CoA kinase [Gammaproteobacteria bacterium]
QRLRERFPKMDNKQADAILATQLSADERLRHADDVIENAGSMDALAEAVDELHQKYMAA